MLIIGLTGGFGTGKTYVASVFGSLGAREIDADRIAHKSIMRASPCYREVVSSFGKGILDRKGRIDRKRLASIVFSNKKELKRLNAIVHPYVIRRIKAKIRTAKESDIVVVDAPLLAEANLLCFVDKLVVVKAPREKQISRAMKRLGIGRKECMRRIRNQMPLYRKVALADYVIDNDGTKRETKKQVLKTWRMIWR